MANQEYELESPPSEIISRVQFSADSSKLLVGAWDRTVSVYRRTEGGPAPFTLEYKVNTPRPVLDVCWGADDSVAYCVGLDKTVRRLDLKSEEKTQTILSIHEKASNKIAYDKKHGLVISTGWDGILHVHNTAVAEGRSYIRVRLAHFPLALSLTESRAIVAMKTEAISIYDLLSLKMVTEQSSDIHTGGDERLGEVQVHDMAPIQNRKSNLKFQIRDIAAMPDGSGFATSSIEGRIAVEYLAEDRNQDTYAFKCHRRPIQEEGNDETIDAVYPVNSLAWHPKYFTFASGGADGRVITWDAQKQRRIRIYDKPSLGAASVAFSSDGKFLATGISTTYYNGMDINAPTDPNSIKVVVRELADQEAAGKTGTGKAKKT